MIRPWVRRGKSYPADLGKGSTVDYCGSRGEVEYCSTMSTDRRSKAPTTVRLDSLRSDAATVTRLASRPGGVRVTDDRGREAFRLVIPSKPLAE